MEKWSELFKDTIEVLQKNKSKLIHVWFGLPEELGFSLGFAHVDKKINHEYISLGWSRSFIQVVLLRPGEGETDVAYCFGNLEWKDSFQPEKLQAFWNGVEEVMLNMVKEDARMIEAGFVRESPFISYSCRLKDGMAIKVERTDGRFNEVRISFKDEKKLKKRCLTDRDGDKMFAVFEKFFDEIEDCSFNKYTKAMFFANLPEKMRLWMVEHHA